MLKVQVIYFKMEKEDYCSAANGRILDKLMMPSSKKGSFYETILPSGNVEVCVLDKTSRYSKSELENILQQKYEKTNADELAGILILKLVSETKNINDSL